MGKPFFIYLLFIVNIFCYGQQGQVNYKVEYEGYQEPYYFNLFFDSNQSFYESNLDSLETRNRNQFELPIYDEPKQVYINYNREELIFREPVPIEFYSVKDSLINIEWEITNNKRRIGGFECFQAFGEFRGISYEAWFTTSIPVNYGPWKITGLPGLILKLNNEDKRFTVTAYNVNTTFKVEEKIRMKKEKLMNKSTISLEEYIKLYKNKDRKIEVYLESLFPRGVFQGVDKSQSNPLILEKFD